MKILPFDGRRSLLPAHLLTAAAFRRRTDAMFARLEYASVAALSTPSVLAIINLLPGERCAKDRFRRPCGCVNGGKMPSVFGVPGYLLLPSR